MKAREDIYELVLRPLPNWRLTGDQRLKAALKRLLRDYGLRAVKCRASSLEKCR